MARMVSCGRPRSCVHMVREYCVRLLRGSRANAPDANQAASAAIVAVRIPTGPNINPEYKPGDRRNVFQFWRLAIMRNRKTFRLSPGFPGFPGVSRGFPGFRVSSLPLQELEAETAPMASNREMKFLLAVLLAPALCLGAIWPENIGAWKRTATMQATLSDRPIWDEYGLKESEAARYENGDGNFTATGYRLQDTTGAMAAFDWQRPAKSTVSPLAPLAAATGNGLLVVQGNYLLSFSGHLPEAGELSALFDGLRNVDTTVLPTLPGCLPTRDRVANSERYITGPASLEKFIPAIPPSVAAFHYGVA